MTIKLARLFSVAVPNTPVTRLNAIRRAFALLYPVTLSHPAACCCVICEACFATMRARRAIERPGGDA